MKTATLDAGGMSSMLDYRGVEKQLGRIPGVKQVTASIASNSATVEYDENVTNVAALKDKIEECGFHCAGRILPMHLCEPHSDHSAAPAKQAGHEHHAHPMQAPAGKHTPMPMSHDMADMVHDMGHGAGMDMQAMVHDMRNRFWMALIFSIPIFLYSPMGMSFISLKPPFGMPLNIFLFFLASPAIIYPGWPFVVGAIRALRNGVLNMAVLVLLSVGTGYLFSVGATFFFKGNEFYEASAVLLVFILLGHWLEMRARAGASEAIRALLNLAPAMATVLREGREVEIPTADVLVGDTVVIRPGNKIRRVALVDRALVVTSRHLDHSRGWNPGGEFD
jgi:Cu2+-exporting ATPase